MGKACAYCNNIFPKLTKEHIWPNNILKHTNYTIRYSERAGKIFSGDMTIKDVCARCNNGPLSKLDTYADELYETYFGKFERPRETIEFHYDFGKLVRWILKVSYNASRGTGIDSDLLSRYAPTIISACDCSPIHVAIFVGRISPGRTRSGELLKPSGARSGRTRIADGSYDEWCATRFLTLNTYMFNIVIVRDSAADARILAGMVPSLYGTTLQPHGSIIIPAPTIDTIQAMAGVEDWPGGDEP